MSLSIARLVRFHPGVRKARLLDTPPSLKHAPIEALPVHMTGGR